MTFPPTRKGPVRDRPHQTDVSTAIDQRDAFLRQELAEGFRGLQVRIAQTRA